MDQAEAALSGPTESRISAAQRAALARIAPLLPDGTYLAGGIALALRFEHRGSEDLDFFVRGPIDSVVLADELSLAGPDIAVTSVADRTVYLTVGGVPVSILGYRHPLLHDPEVPPGVPVGVASNEDIACMKLAAIGGRGAAKDFWDLDVMLRAGVCDGRLEAALERFRQKYPNADPGYILRALVYFDEGDEEPLPVGLDDSEWLAIKQRFVARVDAAIASMTRP